jgi:AraC family 4-hydroxyphenylacetate 3-monooxygenase operon regulatory protein
MLDITGSIMKTRVPVYREDQQTYHADTCQPLIQAAESGEIHIEALARGDYPGRRLLDFALPQVSSIAYWDAKIDQDWGLQWHRNEGLELTFLESGSLPFSLADKQYNLRAGNMTISRPWQPHRLGNPNIPASRLHWLVLDLGVRRPNQDWEWPSWVVLTPQDLKELTILLRQHEHPVWQTTEDVQHCFQQISRAIKVDRQGSSASRLAANINELLVSVLEMLRDNDIKLDPSLSGSSRMVEMFLTDIRDHPEQLSHEWTLQSMAKQCGLAETRFRFYCKELTNMPPSQYLELCRVEAAAKMLVQASHKTVTDIALACGFGSGQYFATVFRRHRRCSPRAFRKKDRESGICHS